MTVENQPQIELDVAGQILVGINPSVEAAILNSMPKPTTKLMEGKVPLVIMEDPKGSSVYGATTTV